MKIAEVRTYHSFAFCEHCFAECIVKVHRTPMILSTFRGHDVFFMSTSVEESPCSSSWWSIWYASMYARARCEKSRMRSMVRISLENHCCTIALKFTFPLFIFKGFSQSNCPCLSEGGDEEFWLPLVCWRWNFDESRQLGSVPASEMCHHIA